MRNKILSAAIGVVLCITAGQAFAVASSFKNVIDGDGIFNDAVVTAGDLMGDFTVEPIGGGADAIIASQHDEEGTTYAAELFGGSGVTIPSGLQAAVVYLLDGVITEGFRMKFTLSDGAFNANPNLAIDEQGGSPNIIPTLLDGGSGKNYAEFDIPLGGDLSGDGGATLATTTKFQLAYQLSKTAGLATPGGKVDMSVTLLTYPLNVKVGPARTVTVAQSQQGTKIKLTQEELGDVNISVSEGETQFVGENPGGGEGAFVANDEVILGYITVEDTTNNATSPVMSSDGLTDWEIGQAADAKVKTDTSLFTIEDGQFSASASAPGQVSIQGTLTASTAAEVTSDEGGEKWTATWKLTDSLLSQIATDTDNGDSVSIRIIADGNTKINVTENDPTANLSIDYDVDEIADVSGITATFRSFSRDGTVCSLFNLPGDGAPDKTNIRITNDSSTAGQITVAMWGEDGTELIPAGTVLKNMDPTTGLELSDTIQSQESWHINDVELKALGTAWTGRAHATFTSTLPKLGVFAWLRHQATGINSNLSSGASGSGCE